LFIENLQSIIKVIIEGLNPDIDHFISRYIDFSISNFDFNAVSLEPICQISLISVLFKIQDPYGLNTAI
jgi:hypothetical protein